MQREQNTRHGHRRLVVVAAAVCAAGTMASGCTGRSVPLGATQVYVRIAAGPEIQLGANSSFEGSIIPAVAGRMMALQAREPGGTLWSTVAASTTSKTGNFTLVLTPTASGQRTMRVSVAANSTNTAATSTPIMIDVEDFRGARARYLACVAPDARATTALTAAEHKFSAGGMNLAALERRDAAMAIAYRGEISCLRSDVWPPTSGPIIANVEASDAVVVHCETLVSKAADLTAYNAGCRTKIAMAAYAALNNDDNALTSAMAPN